MDVASGDGRFGFIIKPKATNKIISNELYQSEGIHVTHRFQSNVLIQQRSHEADVDMREGQYGEQMYNRDLGLQFTNNTKVSLKVEQQTEDGVVMMEEDVDCSKKRKCLPPIESPVQQNGEHLDSPGLCNDISVRRVNKRKSCETKKYVDDSTNCWDTTQEKKTKDIVDVFNNNCNLRLKKGGKILGSMSTVYDDKSFSEFNWGKVPEYFQETKDGSNGSVAKFKDEKTQKELVMKKFNTNLVMNEIRIPLEFKNNPFIVNVLALGYNNGDGFLVMENSGKSIKNVITCHCVPNPQEWQIFKQKYAKYFLLDMLTALSALEAGGIVHCDIKPENICLKWYPEKKRFVAVLVDFGSCQIRQYPQIKTGGITAEYLPPSFNASLVESFETKEASPRQLTDKDDVYGLGMTLRFTEEGSHPMIKQFTGHGNYPPGISSESRLDVLKKIGEMRELPKNFFTYPECPELEPILKQMLILDDSKRPGARELLNMLEGPKRVPLPPAKKMRIETPPGNYGQDLPKGLSAMTINSPSQQSQFVNNELVYMKRKKEQPEIVPEFPFAPDQQTVKNFQTEDYTVIDKSALKVQQTQSAAVFANQLHQTKRRQQKVEPEYGQLNSPDVDPEVYQELMASFAGIPRRNVNNPVVSSKTQQAKQSFIRENSVIDLGHQSKPCTYQQQPTAYQRQPSFQFGSTQASPLHGSNLTVYKFQGKKASAQEENMQALNLRFRASESTRPNHNTPGFTLQDHPRSGVNPQAPIVYLWPRQSRPRQAPETPQEVTGNMPDFNLIL